MKTFLRPITSSLLLAVLAGLALAAVPDQPAPARPVIESIVVDGTNLLIGVQVPAGMRQATLECCNSLDAGDWQPCVGQRLDGLGGSIAFHIPKQGAMRLMRIRADAGEAFPAAVSDEMRFVAVAPMTLAPNSNAPAEAEVVLHFSGMVDGSDTLNITRQGILWDHRHWAWPGRAVALNGLEWMPRDKNVITTTDNQPFLPPEIHFTSARLEIIQSRDLLVLEPHADFVQVHLADTLVGSGRYEFKVYLSTRPAAKTLRPGTPATLRVLATIDGSDQLILSQSEARWVHQRWRWPLRVQLNDLPWDPQAAPVLANAAPTAFLPPGIEFATARITAKTGRDTVVLEPRADHAILHFADNPNGESIYDVTLKFGPP